MNTDVINECTHLSLAGKITFPEVIGKLAASGVERYTVDLVAIQKHSWGNEGQHYTETFPLADAPAVASDFDAKAVKDSITEVQQGKLDYTGFLHRIMNAGCSHYEVFIRGRKAIYFGRDGSQHIENFPPAK